MHLPDLTTVEWATVTGSGFTAVAALAAWATVVYSWLSQRDTIRPNVSAGFLSDTVTGAQTIHFVNGGPGLAIALAYFGVDGGRKYGGFVGKGHLLPGGEVELPVPARPGPHAHFVWVCRDARGTSHVRSYDERTERVSRRRAARMPTNELSRWFRLMYPKIPIP